MSETTIEKQTIYFPPPGSKWNHMEQCGARSQHLGSTGESKPSGAVDPVEPQQPLPALTEVCSTRKTLWKHVLLSVRLSPWPVVQGNAPGTVHSGNVRQLGAWLAKKTAGTEHEDSCETVSLILVGGCRQCHPGRGFEISSTYLWTARMACYHESAKAEKKPCTQQADLLINKTQQSLVK